MERQDDYDDLMGVDLSAIDLDDIELDADEPAGSGWRWFWGIVILTLGGVVLWLPNSQLYQQYGHTSWLFFAVCGGAIIFGFTFGRWFLNWAQAAAERWARRNAHRVNEPPRPPSALARWLTLLAAIGGGIGVVFGLPGNSSNFSGSGYSAQWFLAAGGAVVVGLLLGRWLMMQQHVERQQGPDRPPLRLPPWFKWVTLTLMVGAGGFLLFGSALIPSDDPQSTEFSLGGVAFVVGIGAAIWLVRRFDETEKKIRNKVLKERGRPAQLPERTGESNWPG